MTTAQQQMLNYSTGEKFITVKEVEVLAVVGSTLERDFTTLGSCRLSKGDIYKDIAQTSEW